MPQPAGEQPGQPHTQPGGECRRDAHPEQVVTEHGLADGNQPIARNRLLEIAQPHEMRRHPVTALQHALTDLGIPGFVRDPQTVGHQGYEIKQHKRHDQTGDGPALKAIAQSVLRGYSRHAFHLQSP